MADYLKS